MPRTVAINLRLTKQEASRIEETREDMQRMIGDPNGLTITSAQAARTMMFTDNRHMARLRDIPDYVIQEDLANALDALGYETDRRVKILLDVGAAYEQLRKARREKLEAKLGPARLENI